MCDLLTIKIYMLKFPKYSKCSVENEKFVEMHLTIRVCAHIEWPLVFESSFYDVHQYPSPFTKPRSIDRDQERQRSKNVDFVVQYVVKVVVLV